MILRSEYDMNTIKNEFQTKYGKSLESFIKVTNEPYLKYRKNLAPNEFFSEYSLREKAFSPSDT